MPAPVTGHPRFYLHSLEGRPPPIGYLYLGYLFSHRCDRGLYPIPLGTTFRMADTPILHYLDSLVIVTIILNCYLEHCRFRLRIIVRTVRIIGLSNNCSPIVLLNSMILNLILFQVILLLSRDMSNVDTVYCLDNLVLSSLKPTLFY